MALVFYRRSLQALSPDTGVRIKRHNPIACLCEARFLNRLLASFCCIEMASLLAFSRAKLAYTKLLRFRVVVNCKELYVL